MSNYNKNELKNNRNEENAAWKEIVDAYFKDGRPQ